MSSYSFAPMPPSSQIINDPSLPSVKHPNTITLTLFSLKDFLMYLGLSLSPAGRITHWRHELTPIQMLVSSDQMTCFQSSTVQFLYFNAQSRRSLMLSGHRPGLVEAM